jgi:uncharacterized membrane protein (UPF0127 family)
MIKTAQKTFTKNLFFWAVFLCLGFCLSGCKNDATTNQGMLYPLSIVSQSSGQSIAFKVELAASHKEQEKGLMHRESMPDDHGMIFTYPSPQHSYFWMKNTLIPLDMIFVGSDNTVIHIHKGAKPHDLTPIPSGGLSRAAIEVNAGIVDKYGISIGDKVVFDHF